MSRAKATQLNVRSAFARARTRELSRLTGMTATDFLEAAEGTPAEMAGGILSLFGENKPPPPHSRANRRTPRVQSATLRRRPAKRILHGQK